MAMRRLLELYERVLVLHGIQDLNEALQKRRAPTIGRVRNGGDDANPQRIFSFANLTNDLEFTVHNCSHMPSTPLAANGHIAAV